MIEVHPLKAGTPVLACLHGVGTIYRPGKARTYIVRIGDRLYCGVRPDLIFDLTDLPRPKRSAVSAVYARA